MSSHQSRVARTASTPACRSVLARLEDLDTVAAVDDDWQSIATLALDLLDDGLADL